MLFEWFKRWENIGIVGLNVSFQNIYNVPCLSPDSMEMETSGSQNFNLMTIFRKIIVLSE
jgi:hypothetical protein